MTPKDFFDTVVKMRKAHEGQWLCEDYDGKWTVTDEPPPCITDKVEGISKERLSRLKPAYFSIFLHIKQKTPENRAYFISIFGIRNTN